MKTLYIVSTLLICGWLLFEALKALVTGQTYYNYWGVVTREDDPAKFYFLFCVRFGLGAFGLALLYLVARR